MFDLNPVIARTRLVHEYMQKDPCREDGWLPLSAREHFDTDVPAMVAELRRLWAFERFIRDHATQYSRAFTLVENWDRLVASGGPYPGSEEAT